MFKGKKIFVLGMARSGYYVAKLLSSNNEVIVTDEKEQNEQHLKDLEKLNVKFYKTDNPLEIFDDSFDYVIKNPGVPLDNEVVLMANKLNIPVLTDIEVGYHFLPDDVKIIGITGSNGKTTVTTMIYEILKRKYDNVYLAGNIGYPLCQVVNDILPSSILVIEVSDHQLVNIKDFKCDIVVLTNIYEAHIDFHKTFENYKKAKKRIFENLTKDDLAIINFANEESMKLSDDIICKKEYFNGKEAYFKNNNIYLKDEEILSVNDIKISGMHNYENIMCALLVANEFNVDTKAILDYFKNFCGVEHREEFVCEKNGVKFYNDSKSTNNVSTITALKSFSCPVHLILGGADRNQDFNELLDSMKNVKCIYAIGQTEDKIETFAKNNNINIIKCHTLENAFNQIINLAKSGEVVLLSPACASWDQYDNFETRGNEFKNYCNKL